MGLFFFFVCFLGFFFCFVFFSEKIGLSFHVNRLPSKRSHKMSSLIFFEKREINFRMSSAANMLTLFRVTDEYVMIGLG